MGSFTVWLRASDLELAMSLVCLSLLAGALRNRRGAAAAPRVLAVRLAPWLLSLSLATVWITSWPSEP